jgi:hypothetical protein
MGLQVGSSAACLIYFSDLQDRLFWIEADRFGPVDQLDQGDALLSSFDMGDVGLRATKPLGEINLAQAGALAAFDQERPQGLVTPGIQGHSASRGALREAKQNARNLHLDILHKMIDLARTPGFCDDAPATHNA